MPVANPLEQVILGRRRQAPDSGARLGEFVITRVITNAAGTAVAFRLAGSHQEFTEPAPCPAWTDAAAGTGPHTHVMAGPAVGDRCLIAFVGAGVDRPWCLSWSKS